MIESETIARKQEGPRVSNWAATVEGLRLSLKGWWQIIWTGFVGLVIGVIPGAGASIAAFVAYQQSRMFSKTPELYGTGHPEGVLAPESANNGVTSGTLVPLMAIGVPGGSTAAVMMIVLQYHGVVLGPRLFVENPKLAYGVFVAMVIAYVFMLFTILPLARYMARVTIVPTRILVPIIVACTIVGAFADRQYVFDMGLALVFGVIGYIARKTGFHVTAILIGVIIGPLFEQYLVRALRISQGDLSILFSSTLGNVLWGMLVLSLALPYARGLLRRWAWPAQARSRPSRRVLRRCFRVHRETGLASRGRATIRGDRCRAMRSGTPAATWSAAFSPAALPAGRSVQVRRAGARRRWMACWSRCFSPCTLTAYALLASPAAPL